MPAPFARWSPPPGTLRDRSGEHQHPRVQHRPLLQRGPKRPVEPVLEVELPSPLDTVREEIAVESGVVGEQAPQVERALRRDELAELHHPRWHVRPVLRRLEPMVGIRTGVANGLENHRVSIGGEATGAADRVPSVTDAAVAQPAPSQLDEIRAGYAFDGGTLKLGALVIENEAHADAPVQI